MVSDDTEHTIFVCQSLLAHKEPDAFERRLAWCLRFWLLGLPAGVGLATLRSVLRLWVGVSPRRSGVFSAGNGPAMRAAPFGLLFADDPDAMDAFLERATRLTHSDPKALVAARAVARAASCSLTDQRPDIDDLADWLMDAGPDDAEWASLCDQPTTAAQENMAVDAFASQLGLEKGVTGYAYHTVPVVLYAWWRHWGDFEATVTAVLNCGGDSDTTGAIAGALAGATVGDHGIPPDWVDGIIDWPRGTSFLRRLADEMARLQSGEDANPVRYFWPGLLTRNAFFLGVILIHGFRRVLPPY